MFTNHMFVVQTFVQVTSVDSGIVELKPKPIKRRKTTNRLLIKLSTLQMLSYLDDISPHKLTPVQS